MSRFSDRAPLEEVFERINRRRGILPDDSRRRELERELDARTDADERWQELSRREALDRRERESNAHKILAGIAGFGLVLVGLRVLRSVNG